MEPGNHEPAIYFVPLIATFDTQRISQVNFNLPLSTRKRQPRRLTPRLIWLYWMATPHRFR
jgi:uncharacterized protein YccT (UPF0319 family)